MKEFDRQVWREIRETLRQDLFVQNAKMHLPEGLQFRFAWMMEALDQCFEIHKEYENSSLH